MKKAAILGMYGVALYFILSAYYKKGNTGMPKPSVLASPTYLYGILALTSDFLEGFPIVIAAGLTVALIWQAQGTSESNSKPASTFPSGSGRTGLKPNTGPLRKG